MSLERLSPLNHARKHATLLSIVFKLIRLEIIYLRIMHENRLEIFENVVEARPKL